MNGAVDEALAVVARDVVLRLPFPEFLKRSLGHIEIAERADVWLNTDITVSGVPALEVFERSDLAMLVNRKVVSI